MTYSTLRSLSALILAVALGGCFGEGEPEPVEPELAPELNSWEHTVHKRIYDEQFKLRDLDGALGFSNPVHSLIAEAAPSGMRLRSTGSEGAGVVLGVTEWGRGDNLAPLPAGDYAQGECRADDAVDTRGECLRGLEATRGPVTEWWQNRPEGLEHGLQLRERPDGDLPLVLRVSATGGEITLRPGGDSATIHTPSGDVFSYGGLAVWDATGTHLAAHFEQHAAQLAIVIDDQGATWPLTVDPFVSSSPSNTIEGNEDSQHFGTAIDAAFDVNHDGYGDVVVGVPRYTNGQGYEGAVFLYLGSASGLQQTPAQIIEVNEYSYKFGFDLAVGDFDSDDDPDLAVVAPNYTNGQTNEGALYVFLGDGTGFGASPSFTWETNQASANLATVDVGDFDSDTYSDIVVGADAWDGSAGSAQGSVWLFEGSSSGITGMTRQFTRPGATSGEYFGSKVAAIGDINNDGYHDLAVGARRYSNGQAYEGAVFIYRGASSGPDPDGYWDMVESNQTYANMDEVAAACDVNGDGYADIAVGIPLYDYTVSEDGVAWVFYGGTGGVAATPDWESHGTTQQARFGTSIGCAGDINGDRIGDLIVGSPGYDGDDTQSLWRGGAMVYQGSTSGLSTSTSLYYLFDEDDSFLGNEVAGVGDVNGDGFGDVAAGAPYEQTTSAEDGGTMRIWFGKPTMPGATGAWSDEPVFDGTGGQNGYSVDYAGDVNGDGYADVIVGAPFSDDGSHNDAGASRVFLGSSSGLSSTPHWERRGNDDWEVGHAVAGIGDFNGDGYDDIVSGEPGYNNEGGLLMVYHGSSAGIDDTYTYRMGNSASRLGEEVAAAGDVNGDGYADFIAAAPLDPVNGTAQGTVYLYLGSAGANVVPDWQWSPEHDNSYIEDLAGVGDLNGDGFSDVVIGARGMDTPYINAGHAYIFYGGPDLLASSPDVTLTGSETSAYFGWSVASPGDVNGDGYGDVLVGAPYYDSSSGESNEGRARLFYGSASGVDTVADWDYQPNSANDLAGYDLSGAGDLNGDGLADFVVGRPGHSYTFGFTTFTGTFSVFLGAEGGPSTSPTSSYSHRGSTSVGRGYSQGAAGDVNGDGFGDLLLAERSWGDNGRAQVYYSNGGSARKPRLGQVQQDETSTPIGVGGRTATTDYDVRFYSAGSWGRVDVDVELEAKDYGVAFDGQGTTRNYGTNYSYAFGTSYRITEIEDHNIPADSRRHFRVRTRFAPYEGGPMAWGPWVYGGWPGHAYGVHVRTQCSVDLNGNGICGFEDPDDDGDGYVSTALGGDDCDDGDATVYPGRFEICNGEDEDCSGGEGTESIEQPVRSSDWGSTNVAIGIQVRADESRQLNSVAVYGEMTSDGPLDWYVYEGTTEAGAKQLVKWVRRSYAGTAGEHWFESGPLGVQMQAGRYYAILPRSSTTLFNWNHYFGGSVAQDLSWGAIVSEIVNTSWPDPQHTETFNIQSQQSRFRIDTSWGEGDIDGDGVLACAGDCDDLLASVGSGDAEVCDGLDNDCDGAATNGGSWTFPETTTNNTTSAPRLRGVRVSMTESVILHSIRQYLDIAAGTEIVWAIYQADDPGAPTGAYTRVDEMVDTSSAGGGQWHESSPMDFLLQAGQSYVLAGTWEDNIGYYYGPSSFADEDHWWGDVVTAVAGSSFRPDSFTPSTSGYDYNLRLVFAAERDFDFDGDLICAGDCDDTDATRGPSLAEACNGIDDNCDGTVPATEIDDDADGQAECEGDCDDSSPARFVGNPELCDRIDNDCDGVVPATEIDNDGDGQTECEGDCDDSSPARFSGNPELCDGVDNDCDGALPGVEVDDDGDGQSECFGDCDDSDNQNFDGNAESCDGQDNDCNDKDDAGNPGVNGQETDNDGDGQWECQGDCDDGDPNRYAGNSELCDGQDNDCDAGTFAAGGEGDADMDGELACSDCDDTDGANSYLFSESCDGQDNDCNGLDDAGNPGVDGWETDNDGDGQRECEGDCDDGDPNNWSGGTELCDGQDNDCIDTTWAPDGEVDSDGDGSLSCADCDDSNPANFPGNAESCDGQDNDCNGLDDAGNPGVGGQEDDSDTDGQWECQGDCDDGDPNNWSGGTEVCDGQDNDCTATTWAAGGEVDSDGDGSLSCADCDDTDPANHPGNVESCDGQDNDCNGLDDAGNPGVDGWETDNDGDGQRECEGDCDDADPNNSAGADELCDGQDNDCIDTTWAPDGEVDSDGDGSLSCADCDDNDPANFPGNVESCDGQDNDCNGLDDAGNPGVGGQEDDSDGDSQSECEGDCDDGDPNNWSGGTEVCDGQDNDCIGTTWAPDGEIDSDNDGALSCADCDDGDGANFPGNPEICDGQDNDCDGELLVDEVDADGDGWMVCAGDCDDDNSDSWPAASEICDGEDNDCDGVTPSDESDADGDLQRPCQGDCDDSDPNNQRRADETACDGQDNDCDTDVDEDYDSDADGFTTCGADGSAGNADDDCDDNSDQAYPGAPESCDGIDSDCDGDLVDGAPNLDGDAYPDCVDPDRDGDGRDEGAEDCDDWDNSIYLGAAEACDLIDSDCDDSIVDNFDDLDGDETPDCVDDDDDGDGYVDDALGGTDCDDHEATTFPGASESCDAVDSDCDGSLVDEFPDTDSDGDPDCIDSDADGDGYQPGGGGDCNDSNSSVYPGATEECDSIDSDCDNSLVDEFPNFDGDSEPDCVDTDDDGDGDPDVSDCADLDASRYHGADEIVDDGTDQDCNGADSVTCFVDNDDDGFGVSTTLIATDGNCTNSGEAPVDGDCADGDDSIYPGATESCDSVDSNCNGSLVDGFADFDNDATPDCVDTDDDADGDPDTSDCAVFDPTRYTGAAEQCDAIDSDCDGSLVDEFPNFDNDGEPDCIDEDDDGDGSLDADDCAPLDATIYPGATESCDTIDSDCDGDLVDQFSDQDGDGIPNCVDSDVDGDGYDVGDDDCNDTDATIHINATESCDLIDSDCDGDYVDGFDNFDGDSEPDCTDADDDNDGDHDATDCDDANDAIYTGAPESCDLLDSDCDGSLVDGDTNTDGDTLPDCVDPDADNDGYEGANGDNSDCNDLVGSIYPGATENCDNTDSDCDGDLVDQYPDTDGDGTPDCVDNDSDGDGDPDVTDCAIFDSSRYTGAPEVIDDGVDQDCNGFDSVTCHRDDDHDSYGAPTTLTADDGDCADLGESSNSSDCDDTDGAVWPGASEQCDSTDSDCDGSLVDTFPNLDGDTLPDCVDHDQDGDSYDGVAWGGDDCDDTVAAVNPAATELPDDGTDSDCDGFDTVTCYPDLDGDGFGFGDSIVSADDDCDDAGEGGAADDCDDGNAAIYPGATEVCNAVNDDCDASTDEGFDGDSDGWTTCGPDGAAGNADDDCNDGAAGIHPDATESCDSIDSDCDGSLVDEDDDFDGDGSPDCVDSDDDGDGDPDTTDCQDFDDTIYTGADEACDEIDADCDGSLVDGFDNFDGDSDPDCIDLDADNDDHEGDLGDGTDCDDFDSVVHPGASEACDLIDSNCNGSLVDSFSDLDGDGTPNCVDADRDGDGVDDLAEGGTDCDDLDDSVYPGATEQCDAVDSNCDESLVDGFDNNDGDSEPDCIDLDDDNDTDPDATDCAPEDATRYTGATELCDGIDSNCDGSLVDGYDNFDGDGEPDCIDADADNDGSEGANGGATDCDDFNADVYPGATESCDTVDSNCDGSLVDGFADDDSDGLPNCVDADADGDGDPDQSDCAPLDDSRYTGAPEIADDGIDQDCNGFDTVTCAVDDDVDGYGHPSDTLLSHDGDCLDAGEAPSSDDCDDAVPTTYPGATEFCDTIDSDCDGSLADEFDDTDGDGDPDCTDTDVDGDGHIANAHSGDDCDDTNATIYAGATEACDLIDSDCDGSLVDSFGDLDTDGTPDCVDNDADGDGDDRAGAGGSDCDDTDPFVYGGATESCDSVDSDCDGSLVDSFDNFDGDGQPDCIDEDDDNDGDPDVTDCDDTDPSVFTGAAESCDELDSDCNGSLVDAFEDLEGDGIPDCVDDDKDGDGVNSISSGGTDCDDRNPSVAPGAAELCDGVDSDCDGSLVDDFTDTDGDLDPDCTDTDDDDDGDLDTTDCNDTNAEVFNGATEFCDSIDSNCDGDLVDGFPNLDGDASPNCIDDDADGDGANATGVGGGDCNDLDAAINPSAQESCDNTDSNCDGSLVDGFDNADGDGQPDCVDDDDDNDSSLDGDDCAPLNADIYPGAPEQCDAIDSDCDGSLVDEAPDLDGDGEPNCIDADVDGDGAEGALGNSADCNDNDATIYPGAPEECDDVDSNCDGSLVDGATDTDGDGLPDCIEEDADNDGDPDGTDCAPSDPAIYGGAPETLDDGIDQDCNGFDAVSCYEDLDGDGHGDTYPVVSHADESCTSAGFAPDGGDCDDSDALVFPGAVETCDQIDNDCDGSLDDGSGDVSFDDTDGDTLLNCVDTDDDEDGTPDNTDCGPLDDTVYPGAVETCEDEVDSDCDGSLVDEFDNVDGDLRPDCIDDDDDNDGDPDATDCEPLNAEVYTGASEICDAIDSDCDGDLVDGASDFDLDEEPDCIDEDDDGDGDPDVTDCAPLNVARYAGADEVCDGTDSDCDGSLVDEFDNFDGDAEPDCIDSDDDNDGDPDSTDCADADDTVFNGAEESCDEVDSDCDGSLVDEFPNLDGDASPNCIDNDDDGDNYFDQASGGNDCDDRNAAVNPGMVEICDAVDDNCDGSLLDGPTGDFGDADSDGIPDCAEDDADGDGDPDVSDCDDTDPSVFTGATEWPDDGVDQDCNGTDTVTCFLDNDGDGYGSATTTLSASGECTAEGVAGTANDCNDGDAAIYPEATELCDTVDSDCDNSVVDGFANADGDGQPDCTDEDDDNDGDPDVTDCAANDSSIFTGAPELCDSVDSDCNGSLVDGFSNTDGDSMPNCVDVDDDGDGDPDATDCAPLDSERYAGAPELCDSVDSDCDGSLVDSFPDLDADSLPNCIDDDADGDGASAVASGGSDCDDLRATTFPGAAESCDTIDSDCDGDLVDQFLDANGNGTPDCAEADADGDGDPDVSDCAPENPGQYTGAVELPDDGVDQDCNGFDTVTCHEDADDDGHGNPSVEVLSTADESCTSYGFAMTGADCDDGDASVYPGAMESCDAVDSDCDGSLVDSFADTDLDMLPDCVDEDDDADGDPDGNDCLPLDPTVFTGATEICDEIDSNCDGSLVDGFDNADGDALPDCVDTDDDEDGDLDDTDCGPLDATIYTGAPEACDAVDSNCNGSIVDGFPDRDGDGEPNCVDVDADGDSYEGDLGDEADCDDTDADVYPGAAEACDGVDSDCDGDLVDECTDSDGNGLPDESETDLDGDGFTAFEDCDDDDATAYPGAVELCEDGLDTDCDGSVVDDFTDSDGDEDPDCSDTDDDNDGALDLDAGGDDCQPFNGAVYPGAIELCDAIDSDCDGDLVDGFDNFDGDEEPDCVDPDDDNDSDPDSSDCEDLNPDVFTNAPESCDDTDSDCDGDLVDGFADANSDGDPDCIQADSDSDGDPDFFDCSPLNPNIYTGAIESCDGTDSDCDGSLVDEFSDFDADADPDCTDIDADGDGYEGPLGDGADCEDLQPSVNPDATEVCNLGIDDDCDPSTDELVDGDGDGLAVCSGDCDDTDPLNSPITAELCDGQDNDCNGEADEADDLVYTSYYEDADGDGYGDPLVPHIDNPLCAAPDGYVADNTDCDDTDGDINPLGEEVCDGADNDCDPATDEDADEDGDGASLCDGDCDEDDDRVFPGNEEVCDGVDNDCDPDTDEDADADADGQSLCEGDCDLDDANVYDGAPELCDEVDNDCDGVADNDLDFIYWYADADADGYGDAATTYGSEATCEDLSAEGSWVQDDTDCDDTDDTVHPGADDLTCDGVDQDCNGVADDGDGDGDGAAICDDCDDSDADIHPGADEIVCNGVDENCSGAADDAPDMDADGFDVCGDGDDSNPDGLELDCDDAEDTVFPQEIEEICDDGLDNDCDFVSDDQDVDCFSGDDDDDTTSGEEPYLLGPGCEVSCDISEPQASFGPLALLVLLGGVSLRRRRR